MSSIQWNATDYAMNSQGQFAWALAVIDRLQPAPDDRVLDIGCGDGKVSVEIARRVPSGGVVGIDSSAGMIELARRAWRSVVPNVDFLVEDAQALKVAGTFDLVFSNSTLHWIPDHPAVLQGVAARLKPGGRLVMSMGGRGTAAVVYQAIEKLRQIGRWAPFLAGARSPHHFFGPEEYEKWLPEAGLKPSRVALLPKPMRHADAAALEGWLRTTWVPYTERIPEAERTEFLIELTGLVRRSCDTAEDGAILLPMVNLEIEATRVVD